MSASSSRWAVSCIPDERTPAAGTPSAAEISSLSGTEQPLAQHRLGGEDEVVGRLADRDLVAALGDVPPGGPGVEAGQQPRVGGHGHRPGLAWFQLDPLEAEQPHPRAVGSAGEVNLRHVGALAVSGVADGKGCRDRLAAIEEELAVAEAGIAQPEAEGVQRLRAGLGEPAVADLG